MSSIQHSLADPFSRTRSPEGTRDAAVLLARERGIDVAEDRVRDELQTARAVTNERRDTETVQRVEAEQNALLGALSAVRKESRR